MKKNILKIFAISSLLALSLAFTGCASLRDKGPYFIADMEPFEIGEVACLKKPTFGKPKAVILAVSFDPTESSYSAKYKDMGVKISLEFSPKDYEDFLNGVDNYLALNKNKEFKKDHKPKMSNSFQSGNIDIEWGTIGYGYGASAPYDLNYEYIEEKPYFRLRVQPVGYPEDESIMSPYVNLYFAPTQLEEFKKITDITSIMTKIDEIENAAYGFEE